MKNILLAAWAFVLLTSFATPQEIPPTVEACPVEAPLLPTYVELDPKPARYAGPACLGDEPCTTPEGWFEEPGYKLTDKGAEITYEDRGQLYTHECPEGSANAYWFEEDRWVKHDAPICWKHEPVKISGCS